MELKMYRSETPSKPIEDDGAWAVLFADTLSLRVVGSGTKRPAPADMPWQAEA